MNINTRIEKIIDWTAMSHAEFAEKIDVQRSSISHILSGRNKPSLDFLMKLKEVFPLISWEWIIEGKGEMLTSEEIENRKKNTEATTIPLPDLFSFVSHDKDQDSENITGKEMSLTEIHDGATIPSVKPKKNIALNSITEEPTSMHDENMTNKFPKKRVKKVILLYEDGTFENYDM